MLRLPRTLVVLACLATLAAAPARAQVHTVPILPNVSFLHTDPFDAPANAMPIALGSYGLTPGSVIRLATAGDWDNGPGVDEHFYAAAVFSGSATLLPGSERYRVPDALGVGININMGVTCPSADSMDTPQDFRVDTAGVVVTIPLGATHLFVMPLDCYSVDNTDPDNDFVLKITVIALAGVEGGVAGAAPLAYPNPFRAGTSVRFALPEAGRTRLAVYDVTGRLTRALAEGEFAAGPHEIRWDGRDEAGRPVARGTYFARIEDARGSRTVRVSAIR